MTVPAVSGNRPGIPFGDSTRHMSVGMLSSSPSQQPGPCVAAPPHVVIPGRQAPLHSGDLGPGRRNDDGLARWHGEAINYLSSDPPKINYPGIYAAQRHVDGHVLLHHHAIPAAVAALMARANLTGDTRCSINSSVPSPQPAAESQSRNQPHGSYSRFAKPLNSEPQTRSARVGELPQPGVDYRCAFRILGLVLAFNWPEVQLRVKHYLTQRGRSTGVAWQRYRCSTGPGHIRHS